MGKLEIMKESYNYRGPYIKEDYVLTKFVKGFIDDLRYYGEDAVDIYKLLFGLNEEIDFMFENRIQINETIKSTKRPFLFESVMDKGNNYLFEAAPRAGKEPGSSYRSTSDSEVASSPMGGGLRKATAATPRRAGAGGDEEMAAPAAVAAPRFKPSKGDKADPEGSYDSETDFNPKDAGGQIADFGKKSDDATSFIKGHLSKGNGVGADGEVVVRNRTSQQELTPTSFLNKEADANERHRPANAPYTDADTAAVSAAEVPMTEKGLDNFYTSHPEVQASVNKIKLSSDQQHDIDSMVTQVNSASSPEEARKILTSNKDFTALLGNTGGATNAAAGAAGDHATSIATSASDHVRAAGGAAKELAPKGFLNTLLANVGNAWKSIKGFFTGQFDSIGKAFSSGNPAAAIGTPLGLMLVAGAGVAGVAALRKIIGKGKGKGKPQMARAK